MTFHKHYQTEQISWKPLKYIPGNSGDLRGPRVNANVSLSSLRKTTNNSSFCCCWCLDEESESWVHIGNHSGELRGSPGNEGECKFVVEQQPQNQRKFINFLPVDAKITLCRGAPCSKHITNHQTFCCWWTQTHKILQDVTFLLLILWFLDLMKAFEIPDPQNKINTKS